MLQTRIKNRLIRRGIVVLALLAALPGTPVAAAQTFDEAVAAYERSDYATAMRGFRVHAEQGHAEAQFDLGVMYANSLGVPENDIEAVKWYRKAAEQGLAIAQHYLGVMYAKGRGVPRNDQEAVKWYHRAAEQGDADAQHYLGVMYAKGRGVPEDDAEAARWYRKAAEQGHADAQHNIDVMYDNDEGVPEIGTPVAAEQTFGQSENEKLANLVSGLQVRSRATAELSRASRLNCLLGPGHTTTWGSGAPSSSRDRFSSASDPTIFYNIDREGNLASMMGNLGSGKVAVHEVAGGLTFIELADDGMNVTTVFPSYVRGTNRFPCVHSRHLMIAFIHPLPSQYHGTCEAE